MEVSGEKWSVKQKICTSISQENKQNGVLIYDMVEEKVTWCDESLEAIPKQEKWYGLKLQPHYGQTQVSHPIPTQPGRDVGDAKSKEMMGKHEYAVARDWVHAKVKNWKLSHLVGDVKH